ncbi:uncharacterized protein LOC121972077 isoform X1 [Zingiber officinale]|uniref:uncharacterized protein LOC121972077 isoform X1 n=1 Tax=Zingiber officinale TaxID=94328 RepID=UPI001C4AEFFB|nr:uncharacterized protein LOC121972077 isoform X1 [Zingiber officinale]XP_042379619.1 uncharacterized protein LOC121972077 isoform X1 [Zingiber officinale]
MKKQLPDSIGGKMARDLDLNSLPVEWYLLEGTSAAFEPYHTSGQQQESSAQPISIIDVEGIQDENLTLSSSGGFPMGSHHTKGKQPVTVIIDVDLELNLSRSGFFPLMPTYFSVMAEEQVARSSFNAHKRPLIRSPSRKSIDCDAYIDLEEGHGTKRKISPEPNLAKVLEKPFTCPICMEELIEAASTICGHIFCMACTKLSIRTQKKCPSCRRKLNMKNFHRVYLPN